jgi:hypothetical protein
MVNLFPDSVQHDTPLGRRISYLYITMLVCSLLAATLYYSLALTTVVKTAKSNDDFFGLDMYQGTTECDEWYVQLPRNNPALKIRTPVYRYSCLFNRSGGISPTVTNLVCQCSSQAARLTEMTRYPDLEDTNSLSSDWCRNTEALEKYSLSLAPVLSVVGSTQEDNRAFNLFSSQTACNAAAAAAAAAERIVFTGATQSAILQHMISWQAAAAPLLGPFNTSLRFFSAAAPTSSTAAAWLIQDTFLEIGVSANQAARDALSAATGLSKAAATGKQLPNAQACILFVMR